MKVIAIAQSLVPEIDIFQAIKDRKRNSELGNFLLNDQLRHLEVKHQFREAKSETKCSEREGFLKRLVLSGRGYIKYFWEILIVILWILKLRSNQKQTHMEYVLLKGLGFQHINPHIPIEEVIESIPKEAFQSPVIDDLQVILISGLNIERNTRTKVKKSVLQSLLLTQKPTYRGALQFIIQASVIGILASMNTKIRLLLNEIPSALLLVNFETKSKFLSFVDTQGSFANLDLFYYVRTDKSKVKSTMIHYSEGGMPFTRSQLTNNLFIHNYELAPVDSHIVWTNEYANFYNSRSGKGNFLALGPQVFRKCDFQRNLVRSRLLRLTIFDETPSLLDEPYEHLREEGGMKFLDAIQYLSLYFNSDNQKNISIVFKQKRRNLGFHSKHYLERLDNLNSIGVIELLPWHINPIELATNSDAFLTFLGASPALIGKHLKLPTAYGYFGALDLGDPIIDYQIPIVKNREELIDWVKRVKKTTH